MLKFISLENLAYFLLFIGGYFLVLRGLFIMFREIKDRQIGGVFFMIAGFLILAWNFISYKSIWYNYILIAIGLCLLVFFVDMWKDVFMKWNYKQKIFFILILLLILLTVLFGSKIHLPEFFSYIPTF